MATATTRPRLDTETGTISAGLSRRARFGAPVAVLPLAGVRQRIGRLSPGSRRLAPLPLSLLLHALLLAVLLISFHRRRPQLTLPLNGVSVVFQGGLPQNSAVNTAPNRRATTLPSPSKGLPAPPPPAPPAPVQHHPTPAPAAPEVNLGQVQPQPFQVPEAAVPQFIIPPPQPHAAPRIARRPPEQKFLVMNGMSFHAPPEPKVLNPGHQGLDLHPANNNATQRSTLVEIQGHVGSGWDSALKRWAQEHGYYPDAAARLGQQGDVTVDLVIDRSGKVLSERLVRGSESAFLNMAWTGLWRDAHVPPFPPGTKDKTVKVRFTARYRLIP
jgi:protein TonB